MYNFVYLNPLAEMGLEFRLAMRIHDETDEGLWHGCFKGHRVVRQSFGCFLRLLYMAEHGLRNPMHLPVQLTRNLTPMRYTLPWGRRCESPVSVEVLGGDESRRCQKPGKHPSIGTRKTVAPGMLTCLIHSWIRGESCEILDWFMVQIECGNRLSRFETVYFENHLEILKRFYDTTLVWHRLMRGERRRIEQDEVDDLLVVSL